MHTHHALPRAETSGRIADLPAEQRITQMTAALTAALRAQMRADGLLHDPNTGAPTPTQHYGQLSAALAFLLSDPHHPSWRSALSAWLALPRARLGHCPFNRFLLRVIDERLRVLSAPTAEHAMIAHALRRCPLRADYPSNNWQLLAQLCRLRTAEEPRRRRAVRRFTALLGRWLSADGAFIDYPRAPRRDFATPLTYHYKALFVATVAAMWVDDAVLQEQLGHLLRCAVRQSDIYGAGFGRSTHALFADACWLASLLLLRAHEQPAGQQLLARIVRRLTTQQRSDGLYWLNPAGDSASWDEYMFLSVYNAWFAAVVSWALAQMTAPLANGLRGLAHVFAAAGVAPPPAVSGGDLLTVSTPSWTLWLAARGQPPQAFARDQVELRYAGGMPFHGQHGERPLLPPAGRIRASALERCPALAGWVPVFRHDGRLFGVTDFRLCRRELQSGQHRLVFEGVPTALTRSVPKHILAQALAAVDWRLLDGAWGRRAALRRPALAGLSATLRLTIAPPRPALMVALQIRCRDDAGINYLNPCGHALLASALPARWRVGLTPDEMTPVLPADPRASGLSCAALPVALPQAQGFCLPAMVLVPGEYRFFVALEWEL